MNGPDFDNQDNPIQTTPHIWLLRNGVKLAAIATLKFTQNFILEFPLKLADKAILIALTSIIFSFCFDLRIIEIN